MPLLKCTKVLFYSQEDELNFFQWIKSIKAIKQCYGVGDTIYLRLAASKLSDRSLRELVALFYRYKIEMMQLKRFSNRDNEEWFKKNAKAFWHKKIIGK